MESIDKVSVLKCGDYNLANVEAAVRKSIQNLGGLDRFFKPGEKILLKPNLLMKRNPEEVTTTHPSVIEAVAKILLEFGCAVVIGDSPGGPFNPNALRPVYEATGLTGVAARTGAELNWNFGSITESTPGAKYMKKLTVAAMIRDADKIVSISKLKTHGMMTFTGAVKNMFGIIPGTTKAEYHFNNSNYDNFANMLIDICLYAKPVLSIMDGIIAMEGAGPSAGKPRFVGALLASPNPFLLDKAAMHIISMPMTDVPVARQAVARGITTDGMSDLELVGDDISRFVISDFKTAEHMMAVNLEDVFPRFMRGLAKKMLTSKPAVDPEKCAMCRICEKNCPVNAITSGKKLPPAFDYEKCIRCYCCQELCPYKVITIRKTVVLRLVEKWNRVGKLDLERFMKK